MEPLYTIIFRESGGYIVALCLENGIVGQGKNKEDALVKLKEAIECWKDACECDKSVLSGPIPINELHEFLTFGKGKEETFELKAVYA